MLKVNWIGVYPVDESRSRERLMVHGITVDQVRLTFRGQLQGCRSSGWLSVQWMVVVGPVEMNVLYLGLING